MLFAIVFLTMIEIVAQAYTHYIILLVSCAVPNLLAKIIIDVVGLLFNIIYSPVYGFASSFFAMYTPGDAYLYQVYVFVSFIIVYVVKLVVDIVEYVKGRKIKKNKTLEE